MLLNALPETAIRTVPLPQTRHSFRRLFSDPGPGLIASAADDDPSGISTYSMAVARSVICRSGRPCSRSR
jgi:hypothetical protein